MRQVPQYLLIGNGRVARHFQHYFHNLQIPFSTWHRSESESVLQSKTQSASHILLLISDDAIDDFIKHYLLHFKKACLIHFSGSLITDLAYGAHPLMTFGYELYDDHRYPSIPFVIDADAPDFASLLPGLNNPHARLNKNLKAKYHALCVMSGNFSCLLWQKLFSSLENEFKLPKEMAYVYLQQQTDNLLKNPDLALTGPLARNDKKTIEKNLDALHGDPFQQVYQSFLLCFEELKK
jgi:hypothetical protein